MEEDKTSFFLEIGKNCFREADIFKKAVEYKSLLYQGVNSCSETFVTYDLDERLLALLAEAGIRKNPCSENVFSLVDTNSQKTEPGVPLSNFWNFQLVENSEKPDLRIHLYVILKNSSKKRGVTMLSCTKGAFPPLDHLPNFRMFKTLVECGGQEVPLIAKDLRANEGKVFISWTELGLAGIRTLGNLWLEFVDYHEATRDLSVVEDQCFKSPFLENIQDVIGIKDLFILESVQGKIFEEWERRIGIGNYKTEARFTR